MRASRRLVEACWGSTSGASTGVLLLLILGIAGCQSGGGSSNPPSDTTAPTVPAGFTATAASNTQINLAWTASTDNVAVTGYRVERCQGAGCSSFAQIATPSVTSNDTSLTASTSYSYRVRATDAAGNLGSFSSTATTSTPAEPDTTPPSVPGGFTATAASSAQKSSSGEKCQRRSWLEARTRPSQSAELPHEPRLPPTVARAI